VPQLKNPIKPSHSPILLFFSSQHYPFASSLTFNTKKLWGDENHQPRVKACKDAEINIYGNSVVVGHHETHHAENYWIVGDGVDLIPYNVKQKLGYIKTKRWQNITVHEPAVLREYKKTNTA
jgi:hypothetical protein